MPRFAGRKCNREGRRPSLGGAQGYRGSLRGRRAALGLSQGVRCRPGNFSGLFGSVVSPSVHDASAGCLVPLQLGAGREPALPGPAHRHDGPERAGEQHDGAAAHGALPALPARYRHAPAVHVPPFQGWEDRVCVCVCLRVCVCARVRERERPRVFWYCTRRTLRVGA